MRILVADDDPVSRKLLNSSLRPWGYDVELVKQGNEASRILLAANAPKMAILDWWKPGIDGTQLRRDIRQSKP